VYVGPSGVLTGSARLVQEAQEKALQMVREQEVESRSSNWSANELCWKRRSLPAGRVCCAGDRSKKIIGRKRPRKPNLLRKLRYGLSAKRTIILLADCGLQMMASRKRNGPREMENEY